jgi:hypothetical protein
MIKLEPYEPADYPSNQTPKSAGRTESLNLRPVQIHY